MLPVLADAQIYIDSYRFGIPPVPGLLLDSFPGAEAAYSLRKLDNDYTGDCIVVQRNNDDTLAIAFSGNYLDTAGMKTFCGVGATDTCRVRRWYDQSGNNRTFGQTAKSSMPKIMIDGAIVRLNAPVIFFDVANDHLSGPTALADLFEPSNQAFSLFVAGRNPQTTNSARFFVLAGNGSANSAQNDYIVLAAATANDGALATRNFTSPSTTVDKNLSYASNAAQTHGLFTGIRGSSTGTAYLNGAAGASGDLTHTALDLNLATIGKFIRGATPEVNAGSTEIQELVIYMSDKSSDRAAIETNINTFYSIY